MKWNDTKKQLMLLVQKKNALFVIGLAGIFLIFLSDTLFPARNASPTSQNGNMSDAAAYLEQMEVRLEEALCRIEGVGQVKVFLTLEDNGNSVYAQEERSSTDTEMNEAGQMTRRSSSRESEYVLSDGAPVLESVIEPAVKGVSVICEGGDDITVVARITEFVSVGLGLPTNRICVTKMN